MKLSKLPHPVLRAFAPLLIATALVITIMGIQGGIAKLLAGDPTGLVYLATAASPVATTYLLTGGWQELKARLAPSKTAARIYATMNRRNEAV